MKLFLSLTLFFLILTLQVSGQIYGPEGINMPGLWNNWQNPPANVLSLASSTQVPGGKVTLITGGTRRYHTTIKAAASGGDVVGGTYTWLFTSGSAANPWSNKWAGTKVTMNTIQSYAYNSGADDTITVQNGKWYTMNWRDAGYAGTDAIFMETSGNPVTVLYAYDNYREAGLALLVNIKLSAAPSAEEKIFVRYTTDNWTTSGFVQAYGSGDAYAATIPANAVTGLAGNEYYILTTVTGTPEHNTIDMFTINAGHNGGLRYKIMSKYIELKASNVQARTFGPFMFQYEGSQYNCDNDPCGTPSVSPTYAYALMEWNDYGGTNGYAVNCFDCSAFTGSGAATSTQCISESTNLIPDTSGISFFLSTGNLVNFLNACPQYRDYRTYAGNGGWIKYGGLTKLVFSSYRFDLTVNYGSGTTGGGWAIIDVAQSDPLWVAEFDPYGTGQVLFEVSTFSQLVQQCYGKYDVAFRIKPSPVRQYQSFGRLTTQGPSINESLVFPDSYVSFNFTSAVWSAVAGNGVFANRIMTPPSGSLPVGILSTAMHYWKLGTSLSSFTAGITFNLTEINGIVDTNALRILKRDSSNGAWYIWNNYSLLNNSQIRANSVSSLGEWTIASATDRIPVELEYFNGFYQDGYILLRWQTVTEVNNYGFEVQRKTRNGGDWSKIGFIYGAGNSTELNSYTFADKIEAQSDYQYRLKQIDYSGSYSLSKVIDISAVRPSRFELMQNYPNPFNPSTMISYALPEKTNICLTVYNQLGQAVDVLFNGTQEEGYHSIEWNASKLSSGIYFYELKAGDKREIKKLVLTQ